jgi:hypothetical protein
MIALFLLLLVAGCAASPLKQHATAADVTADAITAAGEQISAAWRRAELQAVDSSATQGEALRMVAVVRDRYAPVSTAYEAVRRAHQVYVTAIVRANARGTEVPREVVTELAKAWQELARRGKAEALTFGGVPEALSHMARGPP